MNKTVMLSDQKMVQQNTATVRTETNHLFPVFLKLEELNVLLVGAGKIGLEKLQALVNNAPASKITIVADEVCEEVKAIAERFPTIQIIEKSFAESDLNGKNLLIVAVNDKSTSWYISTLAKEKNILVNVADTPGQCDFYLGSIVQKGQLKIAISTNGQSPTMAKRLKEVLQQALPNELNNVIVNMNSIRNNLNGNFAAKVQQLNAITQTLVTNEPIKKEAKWGKRTGYLLSVLSLMLAGYFIFSYLPIISCLIIGGLIAITVTAKMTT